MSKLAIIKKAFALTLATIMFVTNGVGQIAPQTVNAQSLTHLVMSEVYGGGGNTGSKYTNDYIEIYNPSESDVNVDGWSVQYASATGTSWQVTMLSGTIKAHQYLLVQEGKGSGGTDALPTADVVGTINMGASNFKLALVNGTTALTGATPTDLTIVDFIGTGTANFYEGTVAIAPSNTQSVSRKAADGSDSTGLLTGNGQDTDNNGQDFILSAPEPQNSISAVEPASGTGETTVDIIAPKIMAVSPISGHNQVTTSSAIVADLDEPVEIGAMWNDIQVISSSGVTVGGITLKLENQQVMIGHEALSYGTTYSVSIPTGALKDLAGNVNEGFSWSFTTQTEPVIVPPITTLGAFNLYFGQLHSHTNLSDGQGSPTEAYSWAKEKGDADFLAITDHSNWFDEEATKVNESITSVAISTSNEWKSLHQAADAATINGTFVGIAGFEMTWSNGTGHMNTFNTPWFVSRSNSAMTLAKYYEKIGSDPTGISQLNHPGATFGDFNDYNNYTAAADAAINLMEVGNGEGKVGSAGYFASYGEYTLALDKGWHVAPTNNQDNHKAGWITANDARTVVLATELTRESLFEAMNARRVYATEDKNLEINYTINNQPMGSILNKTDNLDVKVNIKEGNVGESIGYVSIITEGGKVVTSTAISTDLLQWEFQLTPENNYYFVKVVEADGNIAVTAPIWVGTASPVGISTLTTSQSPTIQGTLLQLNATIFNNDSQPYSNIKVEFYKDSIVGTKIGETLLSTVAASGTGLAQISWTPDYIGSAAIVAKATITVAGTEKVFTQTIEQKVIDQDKAVKVLIDGGHGNAYITGYYAGKYTGLLTTLASKDMVPTINMDTITEADLAGVSLLILSDPESGNATTKSYYMAAELEAIKAFTARGGNLLITSRADYGEASYATEYQNANQGNSVLETIGANLRFNDDEVYDDVNYDGSKYRLMFTNYQTSSHNLTNLYDPTQAFRIYSGNSVILKDNGIADQVEWLVKVHSTTTSLDSDNSKDAKVLEAGNFHVLAAETLANGGKVVACGSTFYSDFEIAAADNMFSNVEILKNILDWMTPQAPVVVKTIAEIRKDDNNDGISDLLGQTVTVTGKITSESEAYSKTNNHANAFFEVAYVQDATGGLTLFGITQNSLPVGAQITVTGRVDQFEGDLELQITDEAKQVKVLDASWDYVEPRLMKTADSMLESKEGWLVQIIGKVVSMTDNTLMIEDGSGVARVYVNGYIGDGSGKSETLGKWDSTIIVGDTLSVVGLASEDASGHRIRVRNTSEVRKLSGTQTVNLSLIGRYQSQNAAGTGKGVAEIVEYDIKSQKAFIVNGAAKSIDIVDLSGLKSTTSISAVQLNQKVDLATISTNLTGDFVAGDITSIAIHPTSGYVAVAVQEADKTKKGRIVFIDTNGNFLNSVEVGYWPDMVTFTADGKLLLVANEGEPTDNYVVDPSGSVSVIDVSADLLKLTQAQVVDAGFEGVTIEEDVIIKKNSTALTDLEPEYITISKDGKLAYVSLQENNGIGILDLQLKQFVRVEALGFKDYSLSGIDASDKDSKINITTMPVLGLYQPDGIANIVIGGKEYILTANEGDTREWGSYVNTARVSSLSLALSADRIQGMTQTQLDALTTLKADTQLGRLNVFTELGLNENNQYETLYTVGGRSFSIWDAQDMSLVYDSRSDFEQITALLMPALFNVSNDNLKKDDRSDNKGPEPEGITIGTIGDKTYAFIGLERIGGVMIYDVSQPEAPVFVSYINSRDLTAATGGDSGPEGLSFIEGADSPTGLPLVLAANEVSGILSIYQLTGQGIVPATPIVKPVVMNLSTEKTSMTRIKDQLVTYTIQIRDGMAVNAFDLNLGFDTSVMTFVKAEVQVEGAVIETRVLENTNVTNGAIRILGGLTSPITTTNAALLQVTFKVLGEVDQDAQATLTLKDAMIVKSIDNKVIEATIPVNVISINLISLLQQYDVYKDGIINIADLSLALTAYRSKVGDINWEQIKRADINKDGVVDLADFTMLMLMILG